MPPTTASSTRSWNMATASPARRTNCAPASTAKASARSAGSVPRMSASSHAGEGTDSSASTSSSRLCAAGSRSSRVPSRSSPSSRWTRSMITLRRPVHTWRSASKASAPSSPSQRSCWSSRNGLPPVVSPSVGASQSMRGSTSPKRAAIMSAIAGAGIGCTAMSSATGDSVCINSTNGGAGGVGSLAGSRNARISNRCAGVRRARLARNARLSGSAHWMSSIASTSGRPACANTPIAAASAAQIRGCTSPAGKSGRRQPSPMIWCRSGIRSPRMASSPRSATKRSMRSRARSTSAPTSASPISRASAAPNGNSGGWCWARVHLPAAKRWSRAALLR